MISATYTHLSTVYISFMHKVISLFKILIAFSLVAACSQHQAAPISSRQPPMVTKVDTHQVKAGETLYSIAWQYNVDYRYLASLNGVNSDFIIYPGQQLNLKKSKVESIRPSVLPTPPQVNQAKPAAAVPPKPKPKSQSTNKVQKLPQVVKRSNNSPPPKVNTTAKSNTFSAFQWQWPARGEVLTNFHANKADAKGIDIAGKKGESVLAAANGEIVYVGNGIRGYGNLVIVRHNSEYMSAYAHNHRINVKEGEQVTGGQRIAELGSTGAGAKNRTVLHFQVRKNGKPIDPITVLPKRNF